MIQVLRESQFAETIREFCQGFDAVSSDGVPVVIGAMGRTVGTWRDYDDTHTYQCASFVDEEDNLVPIVYHVYPTDMKIPSEFDVAAQAMADADSTLVEQVTVDYAAILLRELDDSTLSHIATRMFHTGDDVVVTGNGYAPAGDGYTIVTRMKVASYNYWTTYIRKGNATFQVHTADRMVNVTRSAPSRDALARGLYALTQLLLETDKGLVRPIPMEYIAALFGLIATPPTIEEVSDASGTANNGASTAIARVEPARIDPANAARQFVAPLSNGDGVHL